MLKTWSRGRTKNRDSLEQRLGGVTVPERVCGDALEFGVFLAKTSEPAANAVPRPGLTGAILLSCRAEERTLRVVLHEFFGEILHCWTEVDDPGCAVAVRLVFLKNPHGPVPGHLVGFHTGDLHGAGTRFEERKAALPEEAIADRGHEQLPLSGGQDPLAFFLVGFLTPARGLSLMSFFSTAQLNIL